MIWIYRGDYYNQNQIDNLVDVLSWPKYSMNIFVGILIEYNN